MPKIAELKPCPFCGKIPIMRRENGMYFVSCDNKHCKVYVKTKKYLTENIARKHWNNREVV